MKKKNAKADEFKGLRARAEKTLKKKIEKIQKESKGDFQKTIHELHVHQIELEMQNEELRAAQQQLERSRNRYSDLYDFAPVGYLTFDEKGHVVEANLTACRMLGVERASLIKKSFHKFVSKESQDTFYKHHHAALMPGLSQNCEIVVVRKDKDKFDALLESVAVEDKGDNHNYTRTAVTDITERKKVERMMEDIRHMLADEKNRLEAVMDALPVGISIIDEKGGTLQSNAAFERVWGDPLPRTDSVKDYAKYKAWRPETGKPVKPEEWASAQALQKGKTVAGQLFEIERFDGSHAYVLNSAAPIFGADGKVAGSAVAILDITKQKMVEEALRESQERLALAANAGQIGIFDWHIQTGELYWSRHHEIIFGYKPTTTTTTTTTTTYSYRNWADRVHPDDLPGVEEGVRRSMAEHKGYQAEYRIVWPDGSVHWIDINAIFYYDSKGKATRMMGAIRDITERKLAEEALRESEERFRVAQELSPDGFSILRPLRDTKGRVVDFTWVYANAATEGIVGMKLSKLAGRSLLELFPGHRGSPIFESYQKAAETGETRITESLYEGDGILLKRWFRVAVVSMGQDIAVLSQDTTERKKAEEEIRRNLEELKRFNAAMVDREMRMIELKKELNELYKRSGMPERYPLNFNQDKESSLFK